MGSWQRIFDQEKLFDYIASDPERNLYIYYDVEQYGLNDTVSVYALTNDKNEWEAIILSMRNNHVVYSHDDTADIATLATHIKAMAENGTPRSINASLAQAKGLALYFPTHEYKESELASCSKDSLAQGIFELPAGYHLRPLHESDLEDLYDLMLSIEDTPHYPPHTRERAEAIQNKITVMRARCAAYGVYCGSKLVATASLSAVSRRAAMLSGVGTHPKHRGKGLASAVVHQLCMDSFDRGIEAICLVFFNAAAGRIYRRIGFVGSIDYGLLVRKD